MSEFWSMLVLGVILAALSLSVGAMMGYDCGREAGIRAERPRRAAEQERRRRAGQIKPPPGHSGASDVVERCRAEGGCCARSPRARWIDAKLDAIEHDLTEHDDRLPRATWPDLTKEATDEPHPPIFRRRSRAARNRRARHAAADAPLHERLARRMGLRAPREGVGREG